MRKRRDEDYLICFLLNIVDEIWGIIENRICRIGFDICQKVIRCSVSKEIISILNTLINVDRDISIE